MSRHSPTSSDADPSPSPEAPWLLYSDRQRWGYLALLFLVSTSNYLDRHVLSIVLEPIKEEFQVSDTSLGLLSGFSFSLFYAVLGLPVARWADRGNRRTIITIALSLWSLMTMICGVANSFVQLALARVGVGVGESGAIPPAQSLLADYFSPIKRPLAISIFTGAATIGYLLGVGGAGYVAHLYGWRAAFLVAGAPGLLLAVIVFIGLAEPRIEIGFPRAHTATETIMQSLKCLWAKPSYIWALSTLVLYFFLTYGVLVFVPAYLIRVTGASVAEVGLGFGLTSAVAAVVGTVGGGFLANHLAKRDIRWLAWLPLIACGLAVPTYITAFAMADFQTFLALNMLSTLLLQGAVPSANTAIHAICGGARRATAIAILLFSGTLIGGGFGPLLTGALSDGLTNTYGTAALGQTLLILSAILLPCCCVGFFFLGRTIVGDMEDHG